MLNNKRLGKSLPLWQGEYTPLITSYSAITTFFECPRRYKKRYVERQSDYDLPSIEMDYGGAIHRTLSQFFNSSNESRTLDCLMGFFREQWKPKAQVSLETEQTWLKKAEYVLERFFHENDMLAIPIAVEKPFKLNLENGQVIGRVDRIDRELGTNIILWDYKTCENPISGDKTEDDLQSTIYYLAFNNLPYTRVKFFLYSFIDQGTNIKIDKSTRSQESMVKEVEEILEKIKNEIDYSPRKNDHCRLCLWRYDCVLHQGKTLHKA